MNDKELYVVIETGGSIGENAKRGSERLGVFKIFTDKEEAKKKTKSLSNYFGGGYYNYHFKTKTLAYAKKWCLESEINALYTTEDIKGVKYERTI